VRSVGCIGRRDKESCRGVFVRFFITPLQPKESCPVWFRRISLPFRSWSIWHEFSRALFNSFKMVRCDFFVSFRCLQVLALRVQTPFTQPETWLFYEFVPIALFASSLFVYMVVLIFMKWTINWNSRMLSTCLDPDGDGWGSVLIMIEWTVCDQSGDGTCTVGLLLYWQRRHCRQMRLQL
jgi:hypothetical protein